MVVLLEVAVVVEVKAAVVEVALGVVRERESDRYAKLFVWQVEEKYLPRDNRRAAIQNGSTTLKAMKRTNGS